MSKKNLSQSITDAWKTAVKNGQQLNENNQKREQEVSKIFDSARTDVIEHALEYDHGFYRPDIDPFFAEVDGGMLRRKRLMEQEETEEEKEARKKREELQAQRAISDGPKAQQTQTGQTISNRPETGIAALDQKPKATPGSEEYSKRGGSARDAETRGAIDDLDVGAGEKQSRKDVLSRAQADPDERRRLENMSDEELRDELNSQQLANVKAKRLERDKDKIASGDMDAEGKLTGQGAQKRMDNQAKIAARRLSVINQKIAQRKALSGSDDPRVKRLEAEKIGIEGSQARARTRLQDLVDRDKPAVIPAATTAGGNTTADTTADTSGIGGGGGLVDDETTDPTRTRVTSRSISGGEPTTASEIMGTLERLGADTESIINMPGDAIAATWEELTGTKLGPRGLAIARGIGSGGLSFTNTMIGKGIDAAFDAAYADELGPDRRTPEEINRDRERVQQGDVDPADPATRQQARRIRAGQAELSQSSQNRPPVPAGVNPFEDETYRAWFGTLGTEAQMAETQRVRREQRQLASAPPPTTAPPPAVG